MSERDAHKSQHLGELSAAGSGAGERLSRLVWLVYRSRFPLAGPTKRVGQVLATDRDAAQAAAERLFGRGVVVERVTRRQVQP